MNKYFNIFYFIFYLIIFSSFQISTIKAYYVLPLKTTYDYDPQNTQDNTRIMHNFLTNNIYTELNIGDPSQNLATFIKSRDYCSYIGSNLCNIQNSNYIPKNSETFNNTTPYNLKFKDFSDTCLANEKINLSKNINTFSFDYEEVDFKQFYHAPNNPYSYNFPYTCGVFGFRYKLDESVEGEDKCINLINSLHNNNKNIKYENNENNIDNLLFYIRYLKNGSDIDGNLIIGNYPHEFYPSKYVQTNYLEVYLNQTELKDNNDFHTTFYEVYFYKNNVKNDTEKISITNEDDQLKTIFILENNMFMVSDTFFEYYINNFFKDYINKEICQIVPIDLEKYNTIICDKSRVDDNFYQNFPTAYYYHTGFNTTFEFTKDELLQEKDGLLYFMMYVDTNNKNNYWGIGKIFLKKYLLTFDFGKQCIGYYFGTQENQDDDENNEKKEFDFIENGIYVIIILGVNVLVVFSCLFYAIIYKCTKSKNDPTIMIESFSERNKEQLKENDEENVIK